MKPRSLFIAAALSATLAACAAPQQIDSAPALLKPANYVLGSATQIPQEMTFAQIYDRAETGGEQGMIRTITQRIPDVAHRPTIPTFKEIMAVTVSDYERGLIAKIASRPHPDTTALASVPTIN